MNLFQIPLTNDPDQNFQSTININNTNRTLAFRIRYNTEQSLWWMSITDVKTKELLIDSLPLIVGNIPAENLLKQHQYLRIGSATIVPTEKILTTELDRPDDSTLGTKYWLVWGDNVS